MYTSMMSRPYNDHQVEQVGWNVEGSQHDATRSPQVVLPRPPPPSTAEIRKQGRGAGRSSQEQTTNSTFPFRLHEMLNDADEKKFNHIISWQGPHGFIIHDRGLLEKQVLPQYYLQTRYKSFTRQLTMYGFVRTAHVPSKKGTYSHKFLTRGTPELCQFMIRTKIKSLSPASLDQIISKHPRTDYLSTINDRSSSPSTMESVRSSSIKESTIDGDQQLIMANYIERTDVLHQKLDALRSVSRIHRRSSLGNGRATPNNKVINYTMDGWIACLDEKMACINPEIVGMYTCDDVDRRRNGSLEFEPMDPFETSLEPAFAEELIRIFNLV